MLALFNQIKLSSIDFSSISSLFKSLKVDQALKKSNIVKKRGYPVKELLSILILITIQQNKSIFSGLRESHCTKLKTPVNDLLNNPNYNWRNFLYLIAKQFMNLCPGEGSKYLIFDDTAKEKSGSMGEYIRWFYNHASNSFFKGYQHIQMAWYNNQTVIPVDSELKIGTSIVKHSRVGKYQKGTHIEQRIRFSKKAKNDIVIQMIKRALQRNVKFDYVLWDSWFNSSKTLNFIFNTLVPRQIHLISMLRNDSTNYRFNGTDKSHNLPLKGLRKKAGKWVTDERTGIKVKTIIVDCLDVKSNHKISKRTSHGTAKIAYFKYPNVKHVKAIISTNLELTGMEILGHYLKRWSIECLFKDLKQYHGYNQNKGSKYSALVADHTIRLATYIIFCLKKEQENRHVRQKKKKTTMQIFIDFKEELLEITIKKVIKSCLTENLMSFLQYLFDSGILTIEEAIRKSGTLIAMFFYEKDYHEKIEDIKINHEKHKVHKRRLVGCMSTI